jgi:hypothetical protein
MSHPKPRTFSILWSFLFELLRRPTGKWLQDIAKRADKIVACAKNTTYVGAFRAMGAHILENARSEFQ